MAPSGLGFSFRELLHIRTGVNKSQYQRTETDADKKENNAGRHRCHSTRAPNAQSQKDSSRTFKVSPHGVGHSVGTPDLTGCLTEVLQNQAYVQAKDAEPLLTAAYERLLRKYIADDHDLCASLQKSLVLRQNIIMALATGKSDTIEIRGLSQKSPKDNRQVVNGLISSAANQHLIQGLLYLTERIDWYSQLPDILSNEKSGNGPKSTLKAHILDSVLHLYENVTVYQMRVFCSLFRSHGAIFLRGIFTLDNWDAGLMESIKTVEEDLASQCQAFLSLETSLRLEAMKSMIDPNHKELMEALRQLNPDQITEDDQEIVSQLSSTDSRKTKNMLERLVVEGTTSWILRSSEFKDWQYCEKSILWVEGNPGTGKTMLMTTIIDHLEGVARASESTCLSFHYCQAYALRANNAVSIIQSLLYILVTQKPALVTHLRTKYKATKDQLFENNDAFTALVSIFRGILRDPRLSRVYLVVDALDECANGLDLLLGLINETSQMPVPKIQWIVSSRPSPQIAGLFLKIDHIKLSLEAKSEIRSDINRYIDSKLFEMERTRPMSQAVKDSIHLTAEEKGNETFIWASMMLREIKLAVSENEIRHILKGIPRGLEEMYRHILSEIETISGLQMWHDCVSVLSILALAYRPIGLLELSALSRLKGHSGEQPAVEKVLAACQSLVSIHNGVVLFIHQSVRDYVVTADFFKGTLGHFNLFFQSLRIMSGNLRQNILNWKNVDTMRDKAISHELNEGPLASLKYCSVYWAHHLCSAVEGDDSYEDILLEEGEVFSFLKTHFLHLLEVLSLLGQFSEGILSLRLLRRLTMGRNGSFNGLAKLLKDGEIFARTFGSIIQRFPLQTYCAGLAFCPNRSVIKQLFWEERPSFLKDIRGAQDFWGGCLQVVEGHSKPIHSIAFSPDGKALASASSDRSILVWETEMGINIQRLEGHSGTVFDVSFSPDNKWIVSASGDKSVGLWNFDKGLNQKFIQSHGETVKTLKFVSDSTKFVTTARDNTVLLWDAENETHEKIIGDRFLDLNSAIFSPQGTRIALAVGRTVQVYTFPEAIHELTLEGHDNTVYDVKFSPDSLKIASSSHDNTVRVWDMNGITKWIFRGHTGAVFAICFSSDGQKLASASSDRTVRLWNMEEGTLIRKFEGHRDWINAVAFSPDNQIIASGSHDKTVRLWDAEENEQSNPSHSAKFRTLALSPSGEIFAFISGDWKVQIWNAVMGKALHSIETQGSIITNIAFSLNSKLLATISNDKKVRLYRTNDGGLQCTLEGHERRINAVSFAPDNNLLASASNDRTVRIWNVHTGHLEKKICCHQDWVSIVAFAPDSGTVASSSVDRTVHLWTWKDGHHIREFKNNPLPKALYFSDNGKELHIGRRWIDVDTGETSARSKLKLARTSLDDDWISRDGKKIIWLPPDYRPTCSVFHDDVAMMGHEFGGLTFLKFATD